MTVTGCKKQIHSKTNNIFGRKHIILEGSSNKKEPVLLVIVPGAKLGPESYVDLGKKIISQSSQNIWIAITDFPGNFPNPIQMTGKIKWVRQLVAEKGQTFVDQQVFVAGHSLGGIMAAPSVKELKIGGLIHLASYLPQSKVAGNQQLSEFPTPVLTIGGTRDGLTRASFIARELAKAEAMDKSMEHRYRIQRKSVHLVSGAKHSHFSDGFFQEGDLETDSSLQKSREKIIALIDAFITLNSSNESDDTIIDTKVNILKSSEKDTKQWLSGYYQMQLADKDHCLFAQKIIGNVNDAEYAEFEVIQDDYAPNYVEFVSSKPSLTRLELRLSYRASYHTNLMDESTTPAAPSTIACKMKSHEAIAQALSVESKSSLSCADVNRATFDLAKSLLNSEQYDSWVKWGKKISFGEDRARNAGPIWLASKATIEDDGEATIVRSGALNTALDSPLVAGMHYCKLVAPSRAFEWFLVDSQK